VFADLHGHPAMNEWLARTPAGVANPQLLYGVREEFNPTEAHLQHMYEAGVNLVCASHLNVFDEWLSMPIDLSPDAPYHTHQMMNLLEDMLGTDPLQQYARLVQDATELGDALTHVPGDPEFRVAVVHALEGGHALGGDPDRVVEFCRRGVALITVSHFFEKGLSSAPNALPFFPDSNARWAPNGLRDMGVDVIQRMESCGVIVDVTHMTDHAIDDVLRVACNPVLATHASARALGDHPYSLHDEHIQEIAAKDGLIGVILYPHVLSNYADDESEYRHGSLRDVVRTVLHIIKICGDSKHVAIGSDFGGYIQGPRGLQCIGQIDLLRQELEAELGNPDVVADIMAANTIDFLTTNWGRVC
jgi:microsomal dipeptidase-like Zn-dependent dipeptidase